MMSKEIVVVLGSPRKNGNSEQMADAFIRGAEKAGARVTKIYAWDLEAGCCGCGGCYAAENTPCCQHRDFNAVADALLRADGIVFAAPLYWYGMPGKLKSFIDNMYCFYATGKPYTRKRAAMLCCAGAVDYDIFDGIQRNFELIAKVSEWSIAGQIYAPGIYELGDWEKKPEGLKQCQTLGERFF